MDHFEYREGRLYAEGAAVSDIADHCGTPCYIYAQATLERHWNAFDEALGGAPHLICYAVKANSNLAVLNVLARMGSGFDIVSVGELERVLLAGGDPGKTVFSGVAKRSDEMRRALEVGIRCFNVESLPELERLDRVAGEIGVRAPVSIRVNPDVDARTHPYIATGMLENKFGIQFQAAFDAYLCAAEMDHVDVVGIDCHIGSQLTELSPFLDALDRVLNLARRLEEQGIVIRHLDLGGGLGIPYRDETPPEPADYARAIFARLSDSRYDVILEPGRAIAGNAGILVTRVEYVKRTQCKNFAVVDAAMNDLMRPALYDAWQDIVPVESRTGEVGARYDVVGPVCETGDFLGKDRQLVVAEGDLLAVKSAGAYGFSMASNYNTRPRPAEVLVHGDRFTVVREREPLTALFAGEHIPDL